MQRLNRYYRRSRIAGAKFRLLIRHFALDLLASDAARLTGIQAVIRGRVSADAVINSDGWRGYDGLVDVGYSRHYRVDYSADEFANDKSHVNGVEGFWSYPKRRLQKFNGVPAETFHLHLKECEWRFNHGHDDLYLELLSLLRHYPL